jgi:hypothetical protein
MMIAFSLVITSQAASVSPEQSLHSVRAIRLYLPCLFANAQYANHESHLALAREW